MGFGQQRATGESVIGMAVEGLMLSLSFSCVVCVTGSAAWLSARPAAERQRGARAAECAARGRGGGHGLRLVPDGCASLAMCMHFAPSPIRQPEVEIIWDGVFKPMPLHTKDDIVWCMRLAR